MSISRSILPTIARSSGWRCFATGVPSDTIEELNKVRHLKSLSLFWKLSFATFSCYLEILLKLNMGMYICRLMLWNLDDGYYGIVLYSVFGIFDIFWLGYSSVQTCIISIDSVEIKLLPDRQLLLYS